MQTVVMGALVFREVRVGLAAHRRSGTEEGGIGGVGTLMPRIRRPVIIAAVIGHAIGPRRGTHY